MKTMRHLLLLVTICTFTIHRVEPSLCAQDWPEFRGPAGTGQVEPGGILSRPQKIGLKLRWKKNLGSGYSSVVVSKERVITMYCDETQDLVGCFRQDNGEPIWSVPVGERFKGENGSFDGPISTPLIRDSDVFCLSPRGKLFCLDLGNGSEKWSRDLVVQDEAQQPMYGFATSPILVDDTLIVQTGGKESALSGLDASTGKRKWACTSDSIDSQSPALLTIDSRQIVLAAGHKSLTGVDPANGSILFEHPHGGGNGSAVVPVVFDGNKVLMTNDDGFSTAVSIRQIENQFTISEEWKERSIKNTYNVPVEFGGNIFAYSTRILTCVDAASGKPKWKSRKPGDGFLIVVDGHVILNTKQGGLHIIRATADGFDEVAGAEIFDDLVWSVPAYCDDAVFIRSLGQLACVELVGSANQVIAATDRPVGKEFADLLSRATASQDPQSIVDQYLASKDSYPLIEDTLVHFVYQGTAKDVAVAGDMFGARQERKMQQIPETNTWYYVAELPEDVRLNYVFLVDYKPQTDSRNKRTAISTIYAGEMEFAVRLRKEDPLKMSWFSMGNWRQPSFIEPVSKLRGQLVTSKIPSQLLKQPHEVEVYLPPGYESTGKAEIRYPVVYVFDGSNAKSRGKLHEMADNLFSANAEEFPPAILVFVDGAPVPEFLKSVPGEIVPFIDQKFRTIADRASRICMSNGMFAPMSLQLVAEYSDVFGAASVQTPLIFDADQQQAIDGLKEVKLPTLVFLEWGQFDMFNPDENWDARKIGKRMFDEFRKLENVTTLGGAAPDSTDWSSWRNRFDQVLDLFSAMKHPTK